MSDQNSQNVALVTGASRGLGYETALSLAKAGFHIIATARTQGSLEALDDEIRKHGGSTTLVPMNLMAPDGIEKLAEAVQDRWGKLDVLIANAGVLGMIAPAHQLTAKSWNEVLGVNLIAPARLIRAFEPLLRKADHGRAIFITSGASTSRRAFRAEYSASKAGLDALVQCWAKELEDTNLRVNLVNPGIMRTAMRAKYAPGEDPETVPPPSTVAEKIIPLCQPDESRHGEIIDLG